MLYSLSTRQWKIADYGLTREGTSNRLRTTNNGSGTSCYRAPELCLESPGYNNKVDIWALACIFFEVLTGTNAFSSDGAALEYRFTRQLTLPKPWCAPLPHGNFQASRAVLVKLGDQLVEMLSIDPQSRPSGNDVQVALRSTGTLRWSLLLIQSDMVLQFMMQAARTAESIEKTSHILNGIDERTSHLYGSGAGVM